MECHQHKGRELDPVEVSKVCPTCRLPVVTITHYRCAVDGLTYDANGHEITVQGG